MRRHVWGNLGTRIAVAVVVGAAASAVLALVQGPAMGMASLHHVTDLPSSYRPVGELADRGVFYAAGTPLHRIDDGDSHHGFDALPIWETKAGARTQGAVYGVEDDVIVSAGYLVRQVDLAASKSFHGLSLRELDFPPARYLTVDLVEGATADANLYLWLWHFRSQYGPAHHMLSAGELPPVESLPPRFSVYACEDAPNFFCPRMGRHYTDRSKRLGRNPTSTGDDGLSYGEAAGKLIFIEYSFAQARISRPAFPGARCLWTVYPSLPSTTSIYCTTKGRTGRRDGSRSTCTSFPKKPFSPGTVSHRGCSSLWQTLRCIRPAMHPV